MELLAIQTDPARYAALSRYRPEGWPPGVLAVLGQRPAGGSDLHAVAFDGWDLQKALGWLGEQNLMANQVVAPTPATSLFDDPNPPIVQAPAPDPIGPKICPVQILPPTRERKDHPFVGYCRVQGLDIDLENLAGSVRTGTGPDGPWQTLMRFPYGEIRGVKGADGDDLDVYVGPDADSGIVVVVSQNRPDLGVFDEHKAMLAFTSVQEAIDAYRAQYDRPGFYGGHTVMPIGSFHRWVDSLRDPKLLKTGDPILILEPLLKAKTQIETGPKGGKIIGHTTDPKSGEQVPVYESISKRRAAEEAAGGNKSYAPKRGGKALPKTIMPTESAADRANVDLDKITPAATKLPKLTVEHLDPGTKQQPNPADTTSTDGDKKPETRPDAAPPAPESPPPAPKAKKASQKADKPALTPDQAKDRQQKLRMRKEHLDFWEQQGGKVSKRDRKEVEDELAQLESQQAEQQPSQPDAQIPPHKVVHGDEIVHTLANDPAAQLYDPNDPANQPTAEEIAAAFPPSKVGEVLKSTAQLTKAVVGTAVRVIHKQIGKACMLVKNAAGQWVGSGGGATGSGGTFGATDALLGLLGFLVRVGKVALVVAGFGLHKAAAHPQHWAGDPGAKSGGEAVQKSIDELEELAKTADAKPPSGYSPVPGSAHGGYRKQTASGFRYWYPSVEAATAAVHHHRAGVKSAKTASDQAEHLANLRASGDYIRSKGLPEPAWQNQASAAKAQPSPPAPPAPSTSSPAVSPPPTKPPSKSSSDIETDLLEEVRAMALEFDSRAHSNNGYDKSVRRYKDGTIEASFVGVDDYTDEMDEDDSAYAKTDAAVNAAIDKATDRLRVKFGKDHDVRVRYNEKGLMSAILKPRPMAKSFPDPILILGPG